MARCSHLEQNGARIHQGADARGECDLRWRNEPHYYFRHFAYCDSGMIPWLLVAKLISHSGVPLSELIDARIRAYPRSGEINYSVSDPASILLRLREEFSRYRPAVDTTGGLSFEFEQWRLNARASNTEPLLRLNIETRGNASLVTQQIAAVDAFIKRHSQMVA